MPDRPKKSQLPESQKQPGTGSAASTGRDAVKEQGQPIQQQPTSAPGYSDMNSSGDRVDSTGGGTGKIKR